ncbi:MAG: cyclic nucleotide-binding domain-containing protein [Pseudomonadota bacterium]
MWDKTCITGFKVFEGLSEKGLDSILSIGREAAFNPDEVILEESKLGSQLYAIVQGRVSVELKTGQMHEKAEDEGKQLATLRPGDVFGEIAFLAEKRRSAHVVAIDEVLLLELDGEKLYDLFDRDNRTGYLVMRNIATILAQRLVDFNFRWRDKSY